MSTNCSSVISPDENRLIEEKRALLENEAFAIYAQFELEVDRSSVKMIEFVEEELVALKVRSRALAGAEMRVDVTTKICAARNSILRVILPLVEKLADVMGTDS